MAPRQLGRAGSVTTVRPVSEPIWNAVRTARAWLDDANGTDPHELTCRILKVTEESGEAAGAWIGALGTNPRKGVTHTREDVADELADVALSALVAIESLGFDAEQVLARCTEKVLRRLPDSGTALRAP